MTKKRKVDSPAKANPGLGSLEVLALLVLAGLAILFLALSWRKWPDPLIDFGNNLYTAWRLSNGAVLYRDVDVDYGPLSQYLDGAVFALFGPGLMVLASTNIVIFAAIVATLYLILRKAWGAPAAFAGTAVLIVVFAFSQLVAFGNYNYVTPYSQEATHGFLIVLLLVIALTRWFEMTSSTTCILAGLLFGLTAVLKPEFMLVAGLITVAAVLARWQKKRTLPNLRQSLLWGIAAALPTAAFALYFAAFAGWSNGLAAACHAWLAAPRLGNDAAQMRFLGLDHPLVHLGQQLLAVSLAAFSLGIIVSAARVSDRLHRRWQSRAIAMGIGIALASFSILAINWREAGRCLPILSALCVFASGADLYRNRNDETRSVVSFLVSLAALALLSRMILNPRIYQYGFYQAALAAVVVIAVVIGELPNRLKLQSAGRLTFMVGIAALIVPGMVLLARQSENLLGARTVAVGEGGDCFYSVSHQIDAQGEMVDHLSRFLRAHGGKTLLVLPQGAMLNYLTRMPSPVKPLYFYAGATDNGREAEIVSRLRQDPPDWVAIIGSDLRDYGIARFGESSGSGRELIEWVDQEYTIVAHIGGDPLDFRQRAARLLRRESAPN